MQYIESVSYLSCPIVFDLEFIGPVQTIHKCKIWEMAFFCPLTNASFEIVVDPNPAASEFPEPPCEELFHLTREFLNKEKAVTFGAAFIRVEKFVEEQLQATGRPIAVMISHNTFKSDKPLLEAECRCAGIPPPLYWYFFDSLHYFRRHQRCKMLKNFSLGSVAAHILKTPIENRHRAMADTRACTDIFNVLTNTQWLIHGPIYPFGLTSLRCIRWIGEKAEKSLYMNQIHSLEELRLLVHKKVLECSWTQTSPSDAIRSWVSNVFVNMPEDNLSNIVSELTHLAHHAPMPSQSSP